MFGTIARVKVKPGMEHEFIALAERWTRERGAASGQISEQVFKLEDRQNEYMFVGIFTDRDTYFQNANDPETDRWYRKMRATLTADPEWNDGEVVDSYRVGA
jgi:quinol monooxygenase YgiN